MVRVPFLFVAGAAPLDFLNTEVMLEGRPADLLEDEDDLLRWVAESRLASGPDLQALRESGATSRQAWLGAALRLRGGMRALFSRVADGRPLRAPDLAEINDALSSTAATLRLQRAGSRLSLECRPQEVTPPFLIARATAEFLVSSDLSLVRRCQGSGCILFFYDTTRSHTRRWCSMAKCGNRTKVRAHYERNRPAD